MSYFMNPYLHEDSHEPVLREVFPNWLSNEGIFEFFQEPPWAEVATPEQLNMEYFGNHSGAKYCAPLVKTVLQSDDTLSAGTREQLANIIWSRFGLQWTRLWATMEAEYSPINNYDMTEELTRETENNEQEVLDEDATKNTSGTRTPNLTETVTHGKTDTITTDRYGFNSTDPVPADVSTEREGGSTSTATTGTETETLDGTETRDHTKTNAGTENVTQRLHRIGNIGVTTNQKMLTDERNLWAWDFFNQIFRDVDKILALDIYDPCRV